jgi:hypothetical protein
MSLSSTEYPNGVNEFEKAGLTMLKSDLVKPFRVAESPIQLECKVNEIVKLGTEGGAGNLIICEVLKFHMSESILDANGVVNQEKLDLVARAGGNYYSRARDGFFEISKPLTTLGIGVDTLPESIRHSSVLTGNNLGLLANIEALPSQKDIEDFVNEKASTHPQLKTLSNNEKHKLAQNYLSFGDVDSAWKLLLS